VQILNSSPLQAGLVILLDGDGAEQLCLSVRGVFALDPTGKPSLAGEQPALSPADTHYEEPGTSSIRHEADLGYAKVSTDVALIGAAVATRPRTTEQEVSLRVGSAAKRARVTGPRFVERGRERGPLELDRVPLRWELAAGGTDASPEDERDRSLEPRNPLGRGFRARRSRLPRDGSLPQVLSLGRDLNEPVGFGFIGEGWLPRRLFAGRYDAAWQEQRFPLLPRDFDVRFHNKAAPGLITPRHLRGGEPYEIRGCTANGVLAGELPALVIAASASVAKAGEPIEMHLNGVTFDAERMQLHMLWRGSLRIHGRLPRLRSVEIQTTGLHS